MPWCEDGAYHAGFNSCAEYWAWKAHPQGYTQSEMGPLPTSPTGTFLPGGSPAPPEPPQDAPVAGPSTPPGGTPVTPIPTRQVVTNMAGLITNRPVMLYRSNVAGSYYNPTTQYMFAGAPDIPTLGSTSGGGSPAGGWGGVGAAACNLLTGAARDLCLAVNGVVTGGGGGTTGSASAGAQTGAGFTNTAPCPSGYKKNSATGACELDTTMGGVQRALPGGQTGTLADVGGNAVIGAFGLPAAYPMQVGTITRNDGGVSPILRCPSRMKLGADDLCYVKGTAGVMWKYKRHRPVISRKDMKALAAIDRVQKAVMGLSKKAGLHTYRTARKSCGTKKKK